MKPDYVKFTLRIESELFEKFRFIADAHARSANRELETTIKQYVSEYEKENGEIGKSTK